MDTYYRVGGKQPRNVYRVSDEHPGGEYIGVFFTELDAAIAVSAMNRRLLKIREGDEPSGDEKPPVVVFYEAA